MSDGRFILQYEFLKDYFEDVHALKIKIINKT